MPVVTNEDYLTHHKLEEKTEEDESVWASERVIVTHGQSNNHNKGNDGGEDL